MGQIRIQNFPLEHRVQRSSRALRATTPTDTRFRFRGSVTGLFFYTFSQIKRILDSDPPNWYRIPLIWSRTESASNCSLVLVNGGRWRESVRLGVAVIWVGTGSWCIFWAAGRGGSSARSGAVSGPFWSSPARNGSTWRCCPRPRSASGSAG